MNERSSHAEPTPISSQAYDGSFSAADRAHYEEIPLTDSFAYRASYGDYSSREADVAEATVRRIYAARAEKQKDHIAAGLFAVFLGLFGMHKFYLGYNKAAFTMLAVTVIGSIITLGLAGAVVWVIAIIEGVIYLTRTQSEFDKVYVRGQRDWF